MTKVKSDITTMVKYVSGLKALIIKNLRLTDLS